MAENEVNTKITADASPAEAEVKKAEGVFGRFGRSIRGATAGVRGFVGAITATLGIVTRLIGVVGLVIAGVQALASAWNWATGRSREATAAIKQQREELEKFHAEQIKGAAATIKQVEGVPIAEEELKKNKARITELQVEITKLQRQADNLRASRLQAEADARSGIGIEHGIVGISTTILNIEEKRNRLIKERNELEALNAGIRARELRDKEKLNAIERERLGLMSEQRRLQAQQAAFADRMAADISRMAVIAEVTARQRFGTGPRGIR